MEIDRNPTTAFADILEAAEQLDLETQAELLEVLRRRVAERVRETVDHAEREFAAGLCRVATAREIVEEAMQ